MIRVNAKAFGIGRPLKYNLFVLLGSCGPGVLRTLMGSSTPRVRHHPRHLQVGGGGTPYTLTNTWLLYSQS